MNTTFEPREPREPRSITKSAQAIFEDKMTAPDAKRGKNWSVMQRIPKHIKCSVIEQREKVEERREMLKLLNNHPTNEKKFVFLVVTMLDDSFSAIGFNKLFDNLNEVFIFAKEIGREKVKFEGIVYEVELEIEREAARIVSEQETKKFYIKFYSRNGD